MVNTIWTDSLLLALVLGQATVEPAGCQGNHLGSKQWFAVFLVLQIPYKVLLCGPLAQNYINSQILNAKIALKCIATNI